MRHRIIYGILLVLKRLSRLFYSFEGEWIGEMPDDPWGEDFRLVAVLNHTSLFECLFAGIVPDKFLWRMSRFGIVPIAEKTLNRPFTGRFFWRFIAANTVALSRKRDDTWKRMLDQVDPRSMVIIFAEGHMKRRNGLDSKGRPLVVRRGIAELIEVVPDGKLLLAYSQGLHHIQIPDESPWPRLFQPVRMRFEILDIAEYREALRAGESGNLQRQVVDDLTARRDRYCTSNLGERVPSGEVATAAGGGEVDAPSAA